MEGGQEAWWTGLDGQRGWHSSSTNVGMVRFLLSRPGSVEKRVVTRHAVQHRELCSVMWQPGWGGVFGENGDTHVYGWVRLVFTWSYHSTASWLCPSTKQKLKKSQREAGGPTDQVTLGPAWAQLLGWLSPCGGSGHPIPPRSTPTLVMMRMALDVGQCPLSRGGVACLLRTLRIRAVVDTCQVYTLSQHPAQRLEQAVSGWE